MTHGDMEENVSGCFFFLNTVIQAARLAWLSAVRRSGTTEIAFWLGSLLTSTI